MSLDDARLSAFLDGEMSPSERAGFEAELARSPALRWAMSEISAVRTSLRNLAAVEPPRGFYGRLGVQRRRGGRVAKALAALAAAAAVFFIIGLFSGSGPSRIVPALDDYFDQHAAASEGFIRVPVSQAKATAPDMVPMQLSAAFRRGDVMHYQYDGGAMGELSVFVERGVCDFARLPAGGEAMAVDGSVAWHAREMSGRAVVIIEGKRSGEAVVFTVIGDSAHDADVVAAASHLR